jgi:hypothetical protein
VSDIKEDPNPTYPSLLKSPSRESDKVGRRGLYEHVKNKDVWHFLYSRGLKGRVKVITRRSADAHKIN